MSKIESAYPSYTTEEIKTGDFIVEQGQISGGLTKRELFAAMAMQGAIASGDRELRFENCSKFAVKHADALIEALEEE